MGRSELARECLKAAGDSIRGDWSNLDGRDIKIMLESISNILDEDWCAPELNDWLESNSIEKGEFGYQWGSE